MNGDYPLSLAKLMVLACGFVALILVTQLLFGWLWLRIGVIVVVLVLALAFRKKIVELLNPLVRKKTP